MPDAAGYLYRPRTNFSMVRLADERSLGPAATVRLDLSAGGLANARGTVCKVVKLDAKISFLAGGNLE